MSWRARSDLPLAQACAVAAVVAVVVLLACGLVTKDVTVAQEFQAGGAAPGSGTQLPSGSLTAPLSANAGDLSKLSSVTLQSATLESTDGLDLAFVSAGTITLSATGLATVTLGTLSAPGAVGLARFSVSGAIDLKPYLAAGGLIDVSFTYSPRPPVARGLKLTLVVHASL